MCFSTIDEGRWSLSCDNLFVLYENSHICISALVVQNSNLINGKWALITYIEFEDRSNVKLRIFHQKF